MNETHHDLQSFLTYVIGVLERLEIPYMVVGGFAAISYGVPRLTVDVDIVVDMHWEQVQPFVAAFPDSGYYVSEDSIRDSLTRRYPSNIIETATAAKVDLVPLSRDVFTRMAFERRQRFEYDAQGHTATFITAEDLVVAKLSAHGATGSDKHLRDAQGVLVMRWGDLNLDLMRRASRASGVLDTLEMILQAARREVEGEPPSEKGE